MKWTCQLWIWLPFTEMTASTLLWICCPILKEKIFQVRGHAESARLHTLDCSQSQRRSMGLRSGLLSASTPNPSNRNRSNRYNQEASMRCEDCRRKCDWEVPHLMLWIGETKLWCAPDPLFSPCKTMLILLSANDGIFLSLELQSC